jgi:DNA-binding MarR family transcriptional regulator
VPKGALPPSDQGTSFLLAQCGAEVRKRWARMLADHDLTPHHYGVLQALLHVEGTSAKQLSAAVGIDPRNAPPLLEHLEERALLERMEVPGDRRRQSIALTDAGHELVDTLQRASRELEAGYFAALSAKEVHLLRGMLLRLGNRAGSPEARAMLAAPQPSFEEPLPFDDESEQPFLY